MSSKAKRARRYIRHAEELAAALRQIPIGIDELGRIVPSLTYEEAKQLGAERVIGMFDRDHDPIKHEDGGPDLHFNLTWTLRPQHRIKSAQQQRQKKRDRKITETNAKHAAAMTNKGQGYMVTKNGKFGQAASPELRKSFGSRPMPYGRNSKLKRKLSGKVVER